MWNGIFSTPRKESSGTGKEPSLDSSNCPTVNGNLRFSPVSGNSLCTSHQSRERSGLSHRSKGTSSDSGGDGVSSDSNFKVYVKLKPPPKGLKLIPSQLKLFQIANPAIVVDLADAHQDMSKNVDVVGKRFLFHGAFGAGATQKDIFERVVKPQVVNLLAGENATVMAYGSTKSGKSHTLEGSPPDPGLILRTLEMIFSQEEVTSTPNYKPTDSNKVEALNSERRSSEKEIKKRILSPLYGEHVKPYTKVLRTIEESWVFPAGIRMGPQHEIWLSYLEIREEQYYDLLSPDYQTSHSPLLYHTNPRGQVLVEGATQLHVGSVAEARDVLAIGRNNLKKINSRMSTNSSSSHCIFNITLLKYEEINQPKRVKMSRFSFCDLAAHQESPALDTSLLALVKSLRGYYNTHLHPSPKSPEEFTPSMLTSLFQAALTGSSPFSLITHVNPDPGMYKDTHAALHLTAIHTEILTKVRTINPPQFSMTLKRMTTEGAEDISECDDLTGEQAEELITSFKHELSAYGCINLRTKIEINRTIINNYTSMMDKVDRCIVKKLEAISHPEADPQVLKMHHFAIDQMKSIFEYLQEDKASTELELADDEIEFESMSNLPTELRIKIPEDVDPGIPLLKATRGRKEEERRTVGLTRLLNEAKAQLASALRNNSEADRKLGAVERRYVGLKVKNDMGGILNRHTRKSFNEHEDNLLRLKRLQEEVNAEKEKLRVYGVKCGISFDDWLEMEKLGEVDAEFSDDEGNPGGSDGETSPGEARGSGGGQGADGKMRMNGNLRVDAPKKKSINPPGVDGSMAKGRENYADEMHLNIMRELKAELELDRVNEGSSSPRGIDDSEEVETEVSVKMNGKPSDDPPAGAEVVETPELSAVDVSAAREIISPEPVEDEASLPEASTTPQTSAPGEGKTVREQLKELYAARDCLEKVETKTQKVFEGSNEDPPVLLAQDILKDLRDAKDHVRRFKGMRWPDASLQDDSSNGLAPPDLQTALSSPVSEDSPGDAEASDDATNIPQRRSKRIRLARQGKLKRKRNESVELSGNEGLGTAVSNSSSRASSSEDDQGASDATGTPLRRSARKKFRTRRFISPDKSLRSRQGKRRNSMICCYKCNVSILDGGRYHCFVCKKGSNEMCPECFGKYGHDHLMELLPI
ncbi:uncharacterized protein LOC107035987 [Diachasma alloeum]|uniref:uncharacterized protein LOC107035987 n=1 Tax=Diachasma alloeum TaxID=454923 RepID=UPI0007384F3C|nr:uncharacterized protein LOC107035987 [Diachasma alloeum]